MTYSIWPNTLSSWQYYKNQLMRCWHPKYTITSFSLSLFLVFFSPPGDSEDILISRNYFRSFLGPKVTDALNVRILAIWLSEEQITFYWYVTMRSPFVLTVALLDKVYFTWYIIVLVSFSLRHWHVHHSIEKAIHFLSTL